MAKTSCPITRNDFKQHAKPVTVKIGEVPLLAEVKEFSTGSLGWYLNGKTTIEVAGKPVSIRSPRDAVAAGLALVPEERKTQGLVLELGIADNLCLAIQERLACPGAFETGVGPQACLRVGWLASVIPLAQAHRLRKTRAGKKIRPPSLLAARSV